MKTFGTVIGEAYALLFVTAALLIPACWTAGALRRWLKDRRMDREIAALIASFTEEEVRQWPA